MKTSRLPVAARRLARAATRALQRWAEIGQTDPVQRNRRSSGRALRSAATGDDDDDRAGGQPDRRMVEAPGPPDPIRVFIVDDHEIVRRGLVALFNAAPDIEVVGQAGTVAEATARVPALRPAVAVLDVRLPDGDGITLCRDLRAVLPDAGYLILTGFGDDEALFAAILAGAAGYLLKESRGRDLVEAVRTVAAGRSLLDPVVTGQVLERLRNPPARDPTLASFTNTDLKILDLLEEGLTNRQIAKRSDLAEKTVKNYVSNLLSKLDLERRTQVAVYAAKTHHTRQRPGH